VIIDFGGQYVFNIKRNLLESGIEAKILSYDTDAKQIENLGAKGIILSGGPYSVYDKDAPNIDKSIIDMGIPILGLCYGHQTMAYVLGGKVKRGKVGEYGFSEVDIDNKNPLFKGLKNKEICWMSHGDTVIELSEGFKIIGSTIDCEIAAYSYKNKLFGLQFHPEVSHTPNGYKIIENFAFDICDCKKKGWDVKHFIDKSISEIKNKVKDEKVIIAVSGGVDSTTLAVLANKAIGKNLVCVHVDTGLMRKNESKRVVNLLKKMGLNVILVDATERYLEELKNALTSDEKRKIIGRIFIKEFEKVAKRENAKWLIQGTIAPDVIESTRGEAKKKTDRGHGGLIKIHHNVAGLPSGMKLKLIEPISTLFKYQVRILSRELGLPPEISERQPFPGPGLGCRITGQITKGKLDILRDNTVIVEGELEKYKPSQYFAALINNSIIKSNSKINEICKKYFKGGYKIENFVFEDDTIGVKGDERHIGKIVGLSIFKDGKLGWNDISWTDILKLQTEITGAVREISRVVVILTKDFVKNKDLGIIIRSVDTTDFMTAVPTQIDFNHLKKIKEKINDSTLIKFVGYEITTKPAGTVELI
jgi:GMP synthase (glutamine-hydrolysing)